jgi:hypothetical protein
MSDMKTIAEKLKDLEKALAKKPIDKPIKFLGLFLREEYDKWDLFISADWLDNDVRSGLEFLVLELRKTLTEDEVLKLSRIVPYPTSMDLPHAFSEKVTTRQGIKELRDVKFFDTSIRDAFIIVAS